MWNKRGHEGEDWVMVAKWVGTLLGHSFILANSISLHVGFRISNRGPYPPKKQIQSAITVFFPFFYHTP